MSVAYYTGGRLGDIMRLHWDNIDMAARKIHYTPHKTAKTKAGRDCVTHGVPPPLFALLDTTPKKDRHGLVLKDMGSVYPAQSTTLRGLRRTGQKAVHIRFANTARAAEALAS